MTNSIRIGTIVTLLAHGVAGCNGSGYSPGPSPIPGPGIPAATTLVVFTESGSGFSTTDLRDAQDRIVQVNTAGELIWTADGTRLPGFQVFPSTQTGGPFYFIEGRICPEGCAFEVRFGTVNGERRAYLTVDYGHDNPGTLVNVEVKDGALIVSRTNVYPPGTFALFGTVTEATAAGVVPVEGVYVSRSIPTGWQTTITDGNGRYRLDGFSAGTRAVSAGGPGYVSQSTPVTMTGDTRFDIELVRQ